MSLDSRSIDRMDVRINRIGAALFFDEVTTRYGAEHGIDDVVVLYAAGRAGVMGDVTADQVCSAFGFFEPGFVAQVWAKSVAVAPPSSIGAIYAEALAAGARAKWPEAPAAEVARIGRSVIEGVVPLGMALFAGWRAAAVPGDPVGAAAVTIMTLRELRGDVHVQSVAASGLSPIEAEMATRGIAGAELHGWKPPYPDPEPLADAMAAAQLATSARMAAIYGKLAPDDLLQLDAAVAALKG